MFTSPSRVRNKETLEFILTIALVAEIKEWDNRLHLDRIRKVTFTIASALGIAQDESETISIASLLHDVGKSATPDGLLKKAGNYTEVEWPIVERHTVDGAAMLSQMNAPILLLGSSIALTHHERWDGSGYPYKLTGEQIPLGGQICALADVFDALTTPRTYKQMLTPQEGYDLIMRSSGTLFSPDLVKAFGEKFSEIEKIYSTTK